MTPPAAATVTPVPEITETWPALDEVAVTWCPEGRRHYHCALYDALAGALLLGRLAEEREIAGRDCAWLLAMSTLDGEKRDALRQGGLFE